MIVGCALDSLPRPPRESLAADKKQAIATGDLQATVQLETCVQGGVDGCCGRGHVAQHVQCREVRLRVFLRLGAAVMAGRFVSVGSWDQAGGPD